VRITATAAAVSGDRPADTFDPMLKRCDPQATTDVA